MSLLSSPTLRVKPNQEILFVFPSELSEGVPSADTLAEGTLSLHLKKATKVKNLSVRLIGTADIDVEGHTEKRTLIDREVVIDTSDAMLDKGRYTYAYSIAVPTAAAVYERMPGGSIRYWIRGQAKGLGAFGGDLTAEVEIAVVASPATNGTETPPLELEVQDNTEIGPFRAILTSDRFTVSALLLTKLVFASPPPEARLHSVTLFVEQQVTFTIHKHDKPQMIARPPKRRRVYRLDRYRGPSQRADSPSGPPSRVDSSGNLQQTAITPSPPMSRDVSKTRLSEASRYLAELVSEQSYTLRHLSRLPHDNIIRPSTLPQTDTPIRVRHELVLEVEYSIGDGPNRLLTIQRPVFLASCCCLSDSLVLPEYSAEPAETKPSKIMKSAHKYQQDCLCGMATLTLLDDAEPSMLSVQPDGGDQVPYKPEPERGRTL